MFIARLALLTLSFTSVLPGPAIAQVHRKSVDMPQSARKLIEIKTSGTQRYGHDEIVAASGLRIGDSVTDDDFKKAAQRLGETGVFSDVAYGFSYSPLGTKLDLQLADAQKFVPVRFENFVWFTDEELGKELRNRVPLFRGEVPVAGTLLELLNDALQALLLEKNLPGRVDYMRMAPMDGGDIQALNFTVQDVKITIQGVKFLGPASGEEKLLIEASKKLLGTDYVRDQVVGFGEKEWLPVYLQRGYLKAHFGDAVPHVTHQEGTSTVVELSVPVQPGPVYQVEEVSWTGNKVLPAEKLNNMIHLPVGEAANAIRLNGDLEAAEKAYQSKGYMRARIKPESAFDDAKNTVRYTLQVDEGDLFRMGELEILGLDASATSKVRAAWTVREGEPYDAGYANHFLNEAIKVLPTGVHWAVDVRESVNVEDKTVDVNLRFNSK